MSINSKLFNGLLTEKIRVVFYARVSTELDAQIHSIKSQEEYFTKYIESNDNWELVDGYIDEGITGTSVSKRPQFRRMIKDAENGKFDLILTKEVSRFARNTVDTLQYTRKLKKINIGVIFTLDNINTLDKDGELRLSIMATLAQEEARKVSERVRWEHEKSMKKGIVFGNGNILGYDIVKGKLIINEEQAETVRLIYDLYLQGMGARAIQTELQNRGIKSPTGKKLWRHVVIIGILQNEKYIGKLVQKKSVTLDYLEKKRKLNKGEEEFIIIENNHEPIISEDIFNKVQEEFKRRKETRNLGGRHSNKYAYSGKLRCSCCGKNLKRVAWNKLKDGTKTYAWMCNTRAEFGKKRIVDGEEIGCDLIGIPEKLLNELTKLVVIKLIYMKDWLFSIIEESLNETIESNNFISEVIELNKDIEKYQKKLDNLIEMRTDGEITKNEFQKKKQEYEIYINEKKKALSKYDNLIQDNANRSTRLSKLKNKLNDFNNYDINKLDDKTIMDLFNYIIVFNKQKFNFYLDLGIEIPVSFKNNTVEILPFGQCGAYCNDQNRVDIKPLITLKITRDMISLPMNIKKHWDNIDINIFVA